MDIREQLTQQFLNIRKATEAICAPLLVEDYMLQGCEEVSPPKWHLAHTTWFFEQFILQQLPTYKPFDPIFNYLFNSYYQAIGTPYPRIQRGLLTRPTAETIYRYRQQINQAMVELINTVDELKLTEYASVISLGLEHEQQHQELLYMDIKYNLSIQPDFPVYLSSDALTNEHRSGARDFLGAKGGLVEIGYDSQEFCFDNELPRHQIFLQPYALSTQLVSNGDYLKFIEQGGYSQPAWWLADGWDVVKRNNWQAPLYWQKNHVNQWQVFTLSGLKLLNLTEPVCHVSFYEADAFARWSGCRLPTEGEWEHFVISKSLLPTEGNFSDTGILHPTSSIGQNTVPQQFFGDAWEWTASAYLPYPDYKPLGGYVSEYNGKFMNNQMVLRGGCCVTPRGHVRASYRNFYQPDKRWQFSGIRLATTIT